jgi:hypothetical protein
MMENAVLQGKVADNDVQTHVLEDQVQSLKEIGVSVTALLGRSHDVISQDFQNKMKKMAANFKNHSLRSPDTQVPAPKSVLIKVPAQGTPTHDTAASTPSPPHKVTPVQLGKQQGEASKVSDINPSFFPDQMSAHRHMELDTTTSKLRPNEQRQPPIEEGTGLLR